MELPTDPPSAEPHVFSVSEITQAVRMVLEQAIGQVWVEGEVSNFRKQPSGHQYFTLKDAGSQISCVMFARPGMWRRAAAMADGMQVTVRGNLTVYEARGQYQLNVQEVQAKGAGLLQAKFEALKRKLDAEGLFTPERKRPIPSFPVSVGIVTSSAGAALRDMLNILSRRAPWIRVVISPVRVQGEGAAEEIVAAIEEFNRFDELGLRPVDVIIVGRGGGSAEDLWEFNEEIVARAIFDSEIPVISAVGHEIDFTISDFVADLRAPTPSAAAELVAPDREELKRRFDQTLARLRNSLVGRYGEMRHRLEIAARSALFTEPRFRLQMAAQRVDLASEDLGRALEDVLAKRRERLLALAVVVRQHRPDQRLAHERSRSDAVAGLLQRVFKQAFAAHRSRLGVAVDHLRLISPQATLERGYTITMKRNGALIRRAADILSGEHLITRFADGSVESEVQVPVG
jgi:exodeoxyribonuclease VII large subunit